MHMNFSHPVESESAAWLLLGAIIAAFVVFVLWGLFGAVVVGLFLYYATRPAYQWLNERIDHPNIAVLLTLLLVAVPMVLVIAYATLVAIQEIDQFLATANLEELRSSLQPYLGLGQSLGRQDVFDLLRGNLSQIQSVAAAATLWILRLFVAIALAFYLLRDDFKIGNWFRETFAEYPLAIEYFEGVDKDLSTLYTGNLLTIVATGAIASATFYALDWLAPQGAGLPYPLLLGLLVGVGTIIPAVGMKIVYFPYTAYLAWAAWGSGGGPLWFPVVFFVVTLVVVDVAPDIFVRSYISAGELNMGLVMLGYVLGATAFGWYGIFFAPVILVSAVHFARDVLPEIVGR
jgi:predicted PurR-regulated permease PerM